MMITPGRSIYSRNRPGDNLITDGQRVNIIVWITYLSLTTPPPQKVKKKKKKKKKICDHGSKIKVTVTENVRINDKTNSPKILLFLTWDLIIRLEMSLPSILYQSRPYCKINNPKNYQWKIKKCFWLKNKFYRDSNTHERKKLQSISLLSLSANQLSRLGK